MMKTKKVMAVGSTVVVAALSLLACSVVNAQGVGSSSTNVRPPSISDPQNVVVLLEQLSSPDAAQRKQAADELRQMHKTRGKEIRDIAKRQVQEANDASKK
jgi:hypothetical protein